MEVNSNSSCRIRRGCKDEIPHISGPVASCRTCEGTDDSFRITPLNCSTQGMERIFLGWLDQAQQKQEETNEQKAIKWELTVLCNNCEEKCQGWGKFSDGNLNSSLGRSGDISMNGCDDKDDRSCKRGYLTAAIYAWSPTWCGWWNRAPAGKQ